MGKGDTSPWSGYPPEKRFCVGCGEKLTLKMSLWLDAMRGQAWHHECRVQALRNAKLLT